MGTMDEKVCIVTGGAGSMGFASAKLFLEEGAKVMVVGRSPDKLAAAGEALAGFGDRVATFVADVSDPEQTKAYVAATVATWGKVDVLFSHAGISGPILPITEYPDEMFDEVMAINVRGTFLACKYCLPQMNDDGSIVITSSIMGVTADAGTSGYATSKHALIGLARVVAKEAAARSIRVNVFAPGPISNEFQTKIEGQLTEVIGQDGTEFLNQVIPLGRHGGADEVAKMVLFLASDQSSFSTGGVFMADGGMSI